MREQQIHAGLMAWLKKNQIFYVHSTFGKRSTMTKDAPDFIILHCGRALLLELKTGTGKLTKGQRESFARIQTNSGMVVLIARSVEEAVGMIEYWLGVTPKDLSVPVQAEPETKTSVESAETERKCPLSSGEAGESTTRRPTPQGVVETPAIDGHSPGAQNLFIAQVCGVNYVCSGDPTPGGTIQRIRRATPSDVEDSFHDVPLPWFS